MILVCYFDMGSCYFTGVLLMDVANLLYGIAGYGSSFLTVAQDAVAGPGGGGVGGGVGGGGGKGITLFQQIQNGGLTGYLIIALSMVAMTLIVIHLITLRSSRFMPEELKALLTSAIAARDMEAATAICEDGANDCFLTRVLRRGLKRYQRSAFGPFEFKDALEEAGGEQVARLYRSTDALGLIGAIAPMLGLLGTVIGMVGAFETIAAADSRGELLAGDISKALVTTLMGLMLAMPCLAAFTYFRNRIDTLAGEAAHEIEEMTVPLEPAANAGAGMNPRGVMSGGLGGVANPSVSAVPRKGS